MPAERYYYPEKIEENTLIIFKDQEFHHLANVMRTRIGEDVEIINGLGQLGTAVVKSLEKKQATLTVKTVFTEAVPTKALILAQGIPRFTRLEYIMEKCTELGMSEIWLFPAARSEKKDLSPNQMERLETIAIAAMKQCGRLYIPKIFLKPPLKHWSTLPIEASFFGDVRSEAPKLGKITSDVVFFVGPESGFTDEEIEKMEALHAKGVALHPNILRTDTAAIAALAIISYSTTPL
ncbi:MAG: RsmE family RNA methyltransferase [Parachlamydiaceae bacterium]